MDIVIQWVTKIIIFLLLASIIDLLMPATSMKKYVKLVVGLILMLIFLQPIFYLFNMDMKSALETSFNELYQDEKKMDSIENLINLQETEIQASQDAYILEEMVSQLKDIAKKPLATEHQLEIIDIEFVFSDNEEVTYDHLTDLIVYLKESDHEEGTVEEIEEISVKAKDQMEDKESKENNEKDIEVERLLTDVWELSDQEITIIRGEGSFERKN